MMTDVLVRIMRLPKLYQQMIAWVMLSSAAAFIFFVAATVFSLLLEMRAEIQAAEIQLSRNNAVIERAKTISAKDMSLHPVRALFLEKGSEAAAQADVQTLFSNLADKEQLRLDSVTPQPALEDGGMRLVGVRASFSGKYASLVSALIMTENSIPPLVVRELVLRPIEGTDKVTGEIAVYGLVAPKGTAVEGSYK